MDNLEFRLASPDLSDSVCAMFSRVQTLDGVQADNLARRMEGVKQHFTDHSTRGVLVAMYNGEIIGMLCIYVQGSINRLSHLTVDQRFRRRHIASTLLQLAERHEGVRVLTTLVRSDNLAAIDMLTKCQYIQMGEMLSGQWLHFERQF